MKPIQKEELYQHLSEFLKDKGVELKEGAYTKGIHAGCSLLADAINLSQTGFERAKAGLDKKFDQVRQVIHESTAPRATGNSRHAQKNSARRVTKGVSKKAAAKVTRPSSKSTKGKTR